MQQFGYPRATGSPDLKGRPEFIGMRMAGPRFTTRITRPLYVRALTR